MKINKILDKQKYVILAILLSLYILIRIFLGYHTNKRNNLEPKNDTTIEIPKLKNIENSVDNFKDQTINPKLYGNKKHQKRSTRETLNDYTESSSHFAEYIENEDTLYTDTSILYPTKNAVLKEDYRQPDFDALISKNQTDIENRVEGKFGMKYYIKPKPIQFPQFQKDMDKVKQLEDYLKPSYSKKEYKFKEGHSEETIKEYLNSIKIPEEIINDVNDYKFKYKLVPDRLKGYFVTEKTWEEMKKYIKNGFLAKVFKHIKTVKISEIANKEEREQISNILLEYNDSKEVYGENKLDQNSLLLDLRLLEFDKSDFEKIKEGTVCKNDYELKINRNLKFVLCRERMEQINDYFESYGLIVPEELIELLTNRFIHKPVLLDPNDIMFFDISTKEKIIESGNRINPYNRSPFLEYFLLDREQKNIYNTRIAEQEKITEEFLDKIGKKLKNFYIKSSQIHLEHIFDFEDRRYHEICSSYSPID